MAVPSVAIPAITHTKKPSEGLPFLIGSGAMAGIIGTTVIFPLDFVKTSLQQDTKRVLYAGSKDCVQKIFARQGVRGFYKGLPVNLIGVAPEKALKLSINEVARKWLTPPGDDPANLSLARGAAAGAIAGFCQVIATNPMEYAKIQFQLEAKVRDELAAKGKPLPPPLTVKNLVKRVGGVGALYTGVTSTILRDVPFSMMYFGMYGKLKPYAKNEDGSFNTLKVFAASSAAGAVSAALATPMDVAKTKLQEPGSPYKSLVSAYRGVWADGGASAFFKGWQQRALIISPLFGIALVVFEFNKGLVDGYFEA